MEARRIISQAVPFLVARQSKVLYSTLSSAVTDVWSRFDPVRLLVIINHWGGTQSHGKGSVGMESFSVLLHDISVIVKPRKVVAVQGSSDNSSLSDHPSITLLAALSDLSGLFAPRTIGVSGHVQMKLRYFAAQVLSTPQQVLRALAEELQAQAQALRAEAGAAISGEFRLQGHNHEVSSNLDIRTHSLWASH